MRKTILALGHYWADVTVVALPLRHQGVWVVSVSDPHAALVYLAKQVADLILGDVRMPGLEGVSSATRIRALGYGMPIVHRRGKLVIPVDVEGFSVVR